MEKSYFFNSVGGDRSYQASDFAEYFNTFAANGVYDNDNKLALTADGTSMDTKLDTGRGFIDGFGYRNDSLLTLTHSTADPTYDSIDRVVLRLDRNQGVRAINAVIIQGVPGANPVAPNLVDDGYIKDLPMWQVRIKAGQSTIDQSQITDERGTLIAPLADGTKIDEHIFKKGSDDVHGLLTDGKIIEESGSNSNGKYIRFADGTQICMRAVAYNASVSQTVSYALPASFIDFAYGAIFGSPEVGAFDMSSTRVNDLNHTTGRVLSTAWNVSTYPTGTNSDLGLSLFAIGRWK